MPDGSEVEIERQTDWAAFDAKTDEEVDADVASDPDGVILTVEEHRARRVPNIRKLRAKLSMTQEQFAERFQIPLGTLRDWEQGVTMPDKAARSYLRVIEANPDAVTAALHV